MLPFFGSVIAAAYRVALCANILEYIETEVQEKEGGLSEILSIRALLIKIENHLF